MRQEFVTDWEIYMNDLFLNRKGGWNMAGKIRDEA
jgi:hypothetical protein